MSFFLALALFGDPVLPEITYRQGGDVSEICGVSAAGSDELIKAVLALPDLQLVERKDQYLTMVQRSKRRFWTLAVDGHPAAPAVICRTIVPREKGGSTLKMEVSCFAEKAACDKLTEDFVAHNRSVLNGATGL